MIIHNDWYRNRNCYRKWHKLQSDTVYSTHQCSLVCKPNSQDIDTSECERRTFPEHANHKQKCLKCIQGVAKYCKRLSQ